MIKKYPLNVVYCFDDKMILYAKASIESLLKYNPQANIIIFTESEKVKKEFGEKYIVKDIKYPKDFHFDGVTSKLTKASYFRLFLPDNLPDYDRILYLDVDTLILGDISMFQYYNCEYLMGATVLNSNYLSLPQQDKYINAGVLLMNLKALREDNFFDKVSKFRMKDYKGVRWLHDQTIINSVYSDKIELFPTKYNTFLADYENLQLYCYWNDVRILHFTGNSKPILDNLIKNKKYLNIYER